MRSNPEPDPNYRQASAYEYGELREIKLEAIVHHSILWSYTYEKGGIMQGCAGFTGPFEALAHALEDNRRSK
jgi:hypothetical protein